MFVIQAVPAVGMKMTERDPVQMFKRDYITQLKKDMEERRRVITKSEFKRAHEYVASKLKGVETLQNPIKMHISDYYKLRGAEILQQPLPKHTSISFTG